MNLVRTILFVYGLLTIICIGNTRSVLAMTSTNYTVGSDTLNGGGRTDATSSNYTSADSIGEQGTGSLSSTNYLHGSGFWSATTSVSSSETGGTGSSGGSQGGGGAGGSISYPPVISDIQVTNISLDSATITWNTNIAADSTVQYGHDDTYASGTVHIAEQATMHSVVLTGLLANSRYYFVVGSLSQASLLSSRSENTSFHTLGDVTPPVISDISVDSITETSAVIRWNTNEASTSLVTFGDNSSLGLYASAPGFSTQKAITLTGLHASTTYYFIVSSADAEFNRASSTLTTFRTLVDKTAPANVTNLNAGAGNTQIALSWINPVDNDFSGVRIQRTLYRYPLNIHDGTTVFQGNVSSFLDSGLTNKTRYFYAVYAYDAQANFSSGALVDAVPDNELVLPPVEVPTEPPPAPVVVLPEPSVAPFPVPSQPISPLPPGVPSTGGGETQTPPTQIRGMVSAEFFSKENIPLSISESNQVGVIQGSIIRIRVPVEKISLPIKAGFAVIDGGLFSLQLNEEKTAYIGDVSVPLVAQSFVTISLQLTDETFLSSNYLLVAQQGIRVLEQTISGIEGKGIPGAKVKIYKDVDGIWEQYGESFNTNDEGVVLTYAPNGRYYIETIAENTQKVVSEPFDVRANVLNSNIKLISIFYREPPSIDAPPLEQAVYLASVTLDRAEVFAKEVRASLDKPEIQQANAIVAPIVLTISVVNAASSFTLFNALALARGLFTQPLLLLGRKKRKRWGVIYNSLSKIPIELAIVRLVQVETGFVAQSRVTDRLGRYWFLAQQGNYRIEVVKPGYVFPSQYLLNQKEDIELVDLYHAEQIFMHEDAVIARNIPIDPAVDEETPKQIVFKQVMQAVKVMLALGSVALGSVVLIISPSWTNVALLSMQSIAYIVFKRLGVPVKAKRWGSVLDKKTHKPVSRVIVRIFDKKYNKLLETQISDQKGAYGFFAKENVYYLTAEKSGYKKFVSEDLDLRGKKETVINQFISLEPLEK